MDFKDIFTKETTITVQIMKVDGRKLTASLVQQFRRRSPFDNLYNFIGKHIYGYVTIKIDKEFGKMIIGQDEEGFIKFPEKNLRAISHITENSNWHQVKSILNLRAILNDDDVLSRYSEKEYYPNEKQPLSDFTSKEEQSKIFEIRDKVAVFLKELDKHQILI